MLLVHLSLTNFRNFIRLEMEFPPGPTLVVGPNAQGKTSLLEAIDYLVAADPARAAGDRELVNFLALREPQGFARIVAETRRGDRPQRTEIRLIVDPASPEGRLHKEILVNGVRRRSAELAGLWNAVLVLPDDLRVIEGPPSERRRFLDRTLAQADAAYARALGEYARVITQRNALLRQGPAYPNGQRQLEVWDEQMVDLGAQLCRWRATAAVELERLAAPIHERLTRGGEQLRLVYQPAISVSPNGGQMALPLEAVVDWSALPASAVAEALRRSLEETRAEERRRGMTLVGPHRDELRFLARGVDLRPYGSRGQNRTAMISARLAQAEWLQQRSGEWPVLLLDETLAELDESRRQDVLERVALAPQAVLTAADVNLFPDDWRRQANVWQLRSGTLARLPPSG
jgi:DNA replication and repair protein RecF